MMSKYLFKLWRREAEKNALNFPEPTVKYFQHFDFISPCKSSLLPFRVINLNWFICWGNVSLCSMVGQRRFDSPRHYTSFENNGHFPKWVVLWDDRRWFPVVLMALRSQQNWCHVHKRVWENGFPMLDGNKRLTTLISIFDTFLFSY